MAFAMIGGGGGSGQAPAVYVPAPYVAMATASVANAKCRAERTARGPTRVCRRSELHDALDGHHL